MTKVCFINPNTIFQKSDPFTTGIVYMPIGLAYAVAIAKENNVPFQLIDAFGEDPNSSTIEGNFILLGLASEEVVKRISDDVNIVIIYANQLTNTISILAIIQQIKLHQKKVKICIMENTQAVTAYNLQEVANEFFKNGVDALIIGEVENSLVKYLEYIDSDFNGIAPEGLLTKNQDNLSKRAKNFIVDLDRLPFPAWEEFPLDNYWNLGYGHGPVQSEKYLPLLTSRGCPYPCGFCVVPSTNLRRWRSRTPENVVDEIEYLKNKFGVKEFHIEDLDPTINDSRTRNISTLLIQRNLGIKWKIVAGTKVETIKNEETVALMAKSGCVYVSISPESGSSTLLARMNKPFDLAKALTITKSCIKNHIKVQACFVLGYPGETNEDLRKTQKLIRKLSIFGIDEIAIFVISPVPGSSIFDKFDLTDINLSQLNFSPTWRTDYKKLNKLRIKLYLQFILFKAIFHPIKILLNIYRFLMRRFETKMEMTPYRAFKYRDIINNHLNQK